MSNTDESPVLKWTIISSSAATGLLVDYLAPGWGRPALLTLLIFGSLVAFCQSVWSTSFWMFVVAALVVHCAFMLRFRASVNQLPIAALFLCAIAEVILIAVGLGLLFPDMKRMQRRH